MQLKTALLGSAILAALALVAGRTGAGIDTAPAGRAADIAATAAGMWKFQ